jgi:predicted RNase H-like HicB family nuclease
VAASSTAPGERRIGVVLRIEKRGRHTTISGNLSGFVFKEGRAWVAYCQSLDLSSCGESEEEALDAVGQAIALWLESCIQRQTLEDALAQLGWVFQDPSGRLVDCRRTKLPPAFMIEALTRNGKDWSRPIRFGK